MAVTKVAKRLPRTLAGLARRQFTWTLHYMFSPMVKINPDAETGTTTYYLWELANMRGKSGEIESCWVGGNYEVDLVKRENRWYFHQMRLLLKLVAPYGKGWAQAPVQEF